MHSEASRPNIIQATPAKLLAIDRGAAINQHDLKSSHLPASGSLVDASAE
jgi:hypothetical protein